MKRRALRVILREAADMIVLLAAFVIAFELRFDGEMPLQMVKRMAFLSPYVVAAEIVALRLMGVHRFPWRYVGLREMTVIAKALVAPAILFSAVRLAAGAVVEQHLRAQYAVVPFGVILINLGAAIAGITGVRALVRLWHERRRQGRRAEGVRTLLVGAGDAGVAVANQLAGGDSPGLDVVGFLDDDRSKAGQVIRGIPVLGTTDKLAAVCEQKEVAQVVITIAHATGADIRRIVGHCEEAGVKPRIIPSLSEIIDGHVNLSSLREVSIDDLLGREVVKLDSELVAPLLSGRTVAVTGAGGSIGSELCRQVARLEPAQLLLVERAEPVLFAIHRELRLEHPDLDVVPLMADVGDAARIDAIFDTHRPHVVFHAAAHKHVPMMEWNPGEAVKNNVFGTRCVAEAADRHGVGTFVLVSTDKAVNPTSVMGATKRVAEVTTQALAQRSDTKFMAVRFGNVLGSVGSVIPIFKSQIAAGGPVTVTHPDMVRYFMTIPEASQLVMQAAALGSGGEIFVLDMGEPVKIVDLAEDLIRLSGLEPNVDIPIEFMGLRPGEKLFEELGFDAEQMDRTKHPKIFVGKLSQPAYDDVATKLEALRGATSSTSRDEVREALRALVPEMIEPATDPIPAAAPAVTPDPKPLEDGTQDVEAPKAPPGALAADAAGV